MHGPAGLAETYTFEMLWEDFMGGCLLWYSCYVFIMCQTVPNLRSEPDGGVGRVQGLRAVFPRYFALIEELGLFDYAEELYQSTL